MDDLDFQTLLGRFSAGDSEAAAILLGRLYKELRRLAARRMREERPGHTLQATELVHEAYLRLAGIHRMEWAGRAHFLSMAATTMRRVLADHARRRLALKRGAHAVRVTLADQADSSAAHEFDLLALDDALHALAELSPRQAHIIDMRYFAGLTPTQIADVLGVSDRTVRADARVALAWLRRRLSETPGQPA